jgi:hypothetical protein
VSIEGGRRRRLPTRPDKGPALRKQNYIFAFNFFASKLLSNLKAKKKMLSNLKAKKKMLSNKNWQKIN